MALINEDQFAGNEYVHDVKPPTAGQTHFECATCGSHYIAPVRIDPAIKRISNCRGRNCPGPVLRK